VSREYTLTLETWRQLPGWLQIVEAVIERFQQEAIYIEIAGVPEILSRLEPSDLTR
jgi:hypothetical protein